MDSIGERDAEVMMLGLIETMYGRDFSTYRATIGEICGVLRRVWGEQREFHVF